MRDDNLTHELTTFDGHNGQMPSRRAAPTSMPDPAARAREAFAATARVEALRFLALHPASTRTAIARGAGLAMNTTRTVLAQLEELGYVTADVEQGHRQGRAVRFSLDRGQLVADAGVLLAYIVS